MNNDDDSDDDFVGTAGREIQRKETINYHTPYTQWTCECIRPYVSTLRVSPLPISVIWVCLMTCRRGRHMFCCSCLVRCNDGP